MNATDPRVQSAEQLLTGARLLAGHGQGLVRVDAIGRLLGVSIWQRPELIAWIEAQQLWVEPHLLLHLVLLPTRSDNL